jgi:putative membrane protein
MVDPWRLAPDWEWALAIALFALDYALVVRHLGRTGRTVPVWRRWAFAGGLVLVALALLSPIEHLALTSMLSFHLLQNVIIADWAPPLLLLGLSAPMVVALCRHGVIRTLTRPEVALPVWLLTWYVVHLPAVYDYALRHRAALGVEHMLFIVTGLMFWWPDIVPGALSARGRVLYLFIAMVAMMPLDFGIALIGHPLYDFYRDTPKLWGWSTMTDQRAAGAIALIAETAVLTVAMLIAAAALVREDRRAAAGVTGQSPNG